jgi:methylmalonyl-CoA carboxyltransferase large subunit
MIPEAVDAAGLRDALGAIREELRRLGERVAALEAAAGLKPGVRSQEIGDRPESAADRPSSVPPDSRPLTPDSCSLTPDPAGLSEELLVVIGAAVAAFLGKRPHIKQIRLLGTTAWAQQGRVQIQASHALSARHTRSPH